MMLAGAPAALGKLGFEIGKRDVAISEKLKSTSRRTAETRCTSRLYSVLVRRL
jgi:hypothetical protein